MKNLHISVFFTIACLLFSFNSPGQRIELLAEGNAVSLRGLSVVSERIIWVSGSGGNVARSTDGGKTWMWRKITGYESRDFRDIEAFSAQTAVVMAVGEPALILKTTNGGSSWKKVYENDRKGMFLDAMEFSNDRNGIVIGDPVGGSFFMARTSDNGGTWQDVPFDRLPRADSGEACFAASGTNIRLTDRGAACFVTGGTVSRLIWDGVPISLPVLQGSESQGANSFAVWRTDRKQPHIVVVGGDFMNDSERSGSCVVSRDGGKTWIRPSSLPNGYRSCVEFVTAAKMVTCGLNGVDISLDGGIHWNSVSSTGFHVCRTAKKGNGVFLAGGNGRIAKLVW